MEERRHSFGQQAKLEELEQRCKDLEQICVQYAEELQQIGSGLSGVSKAGKTLDNDALVQHPEFRKIEDEGRELRLVSARLESALSISAKKVDMKERQLARSKDAVVALKQEEQGLKSAGEPVPAGLAAECSRAQELVIHLDVELKDAVLERDNCEKELEKAAKEVRAKDEERKELEEKIVEEEKKRAEEAGGNSSSSGGGGGATTDGGAGAGAGGNGGNGGAGGGSTRKSLMAAMGGGGGEKEGLAGKDNDGGAGEGRDSVLEQVLSGSNPRYKPGSVQKKTKMQMMMIRAVMANGAQVKRQLRADNKELEARVAASDEKIALFDAELAAMTDAYHDAEGEKAALERRIRELEVVF